MNGSTVYVCDSNALINVYGHYPRRMQRVKRLALAGRLKIPEGVYRELMKKTDHLAAFVESLSKKCSIVEVFGGDQQLKAVLAAMELAYGDRVAVGDQTHRGFWHSRAGRMAADGQVVAVEKVRGYTAVSDDRAVLWACMLEDVICIVWTEFARRLGLMRTTRQPQLPL